MGREFKNEKESFVRGGGGGCVEEADGEDERKEERMKDEAVGSHSEWL